MRRLNTMSSWAGAIIMGSLAMYTHVVQACTVTIGVTPFGIDLQSALNAVVPGETVQVDGASGPCNTNGLLIRNDRSRFILAGANNAILNGAAGGPTLSVRGKGVTIQNLTVTGGSRGIQINRGSNAVINNNVIQNTGGDGIRVNQFSFAVITNNTIQNNPDAGITVSETSSARIGANSFDDNAAAAPNVIQNNQGHGISVTRNSQARITSNTISGNGDDGINVARLSQVDTASNVINSNASSGINANDNSVVNLGEDNPANFADLPNQTIANNGTFGIRCRGGSQIRGHLGSTNQLNGNTSQFGGGTGNTFHSTCPTAATSLNIP